MENKLDLKSIEKISKALGDPYRIKIIEAVRNQELWTQCSAVVEMFDLSQSTVSHHISQLVEAGILIAEKEGRYLKVKINKEIFGRYLAFFNAYIVP